MVRLNRISLVSWTQSRYILKFIVISLFTSFFFAFMMPIAYYNGFRFNEFSWNFEHDFFVIINFCVDWSDVYNFRMVVKGLMVGIDMIYYWKKSYEMWPGFKSYELKETKWLENWNHVVLKWRKIVIWKIDFVIIQVEIPKFMTDFICGRILIICNLLQNIYAGVILSFDEKELCTLIMQYAFLYIFEINNNYLILWFCQVSLSFIIKSCCWYIFSLSSCKQFLPIQFYNF